MFFKLSIYLNYLLCVFMLRCALYFFFFLMRARCQETQNCMANTEQLYFPRNGAMLINGFNFQSWFGKKLKSHYEKTGVNVVSI